jgi:hypothetical protein
MRLAQPARPTRELPLWHIGSAPTLRRRDLYDDAR